MQARPMRVSERRSGIRRDRERESITDFTLFRSIHAIRFFPFFLFFFWRRQAYFTTPTRARPLFCPIGAAQRLSAPRLAPPLQRLY